MNLVSRFSGITGSKADIIHSPFYLPEFNRLSLVLCSLPWCKIIAGSFKKTPQVCHMYITRSYLLSYPFAIEYFTIILSAFQGILHVVPVISIVMLIFSLISSVCGMNKLLLSLPSHVILLVQPARSSVCLSFTYS